MNTKFCTSCQAARDADTGEIRKTRNRSRWVCAVCVARKNESMYKSNLTAEQKEHARFLWERYGRKYR